MGEHMNPDLYMPIPFRISVAIGGFIGLFLSTLFNSVNVYVLSTRKSLFSPNLRTCLRVLAVSDILGGIICHVFPIIMAIDITILTSDLTKCNILASTLVMSVGLSQMILMVTTVDRYIAVSRPLRHRILLTQKRIRCILLATIASGIVISAFRSFHIGLNGYCDFGAGEFLMMVPMISLYNVIPCSIVLVTTILNILILRIARARLQNNNIDKTSPGSKNRRASNTLSKQTGPSFKGARTVALVVSASYLVWTPYILSTIIIAIAKIKVTVSVFYVMHWIIYFTFWFNPVIFFITSRSYNMAIKDMAGCGSHTGTTGVSMGLSNISVVNRSDHQNNR